MFGGIKKAPSTCPHCGFVQPEPRELISTYCRNCGDHYTVRREAGAPVRPAPSVSTVFRPKLRGAERPRVTCSVCGTSHKTTGPCEATQCPGCGAGIDLGNVEVSTHSTRVIDTRGTLHVGREAFLNATSTTCGSAFVEGRIAGRVRCTGTLRLRGSGLCRAQIHTTSLIIDRGADLRFASAIFAGEMLIRGRIEADVQCGGTIRVGRYGSLEGDVQARGLVVDKGGAYLGEIKIAGNWPEPELRKTSDDLPRLEVMPAWRTRFTLAW